MRKVGQERLDTLEEQRRINEETTAAAAAAAAEDEAIIGQRMELITKIDCLERVRDKVTSRHKRKSHQILAQFNF